MEYLPSNFSDLLLQLKCNYDSEDTIIKNSLREQHRHGKNLMTYNKVGERVQSCNKYHSSMKVFFKKYSKNNLKLAYIHPIKHHVDIGLLELFLLTYAHKGTSINQVVIISGSFAPAPFRGHWSLLLNKFM